ncbi:FAS1-like dehydratase domain-containing protein [Roseitranquillus sediminis]|uniref:FAS1-like dehydratase domain-containing protein n=1 Tax=Roseitranquillus sediminis TaxID=2809051 RepID=UPI001D0C7E67|nr:MaoC family dehydratase N-terminal domain-containing protein [Roseitranquillus sediminis]MBM9594704.1 MaoC family dehydratase N-terminal domain-containing protein [Roseitranquillus sediminis]
MSHVTDEVKGYIGVETDVGRCWDVVERGAVRRFAQAIMDLDPAFMSEEYAAQTPYGKPVAPPLFPLMQNRLPYDGTDVISERADDPDYDGTGGAGPSSNLPPLPLGNLALLNGGSEVELFRYLHHGEGLSFRHRYADIYERETSKGLMVFVITETDYLDDDGGLVARVKRTTIRR